MRSTELMYIKLISYRYMCKIGKPLTSNNLVPSVNIQTHTYHKCMCMFYSGYQPSINVMTLK